MLCADLVILPFPTIYLRQQSEILQRCKIANNAIGKPTISEMETTFPLLYIADIICFTLLKLF
jgi:hypothetical protein